MLASGLSPLRSSALPPRAMMSLKVLGREARESWPLSLVLIVETSVRLTVPEGPEPRHRQSSPHVRDVLLRRPTAEARSSIDPPRHHAGGSRCHEGRDLVRWRLQFRGGTTCVFPTLIRAAHSIQVLITSLIVPVVLVHELSSADVPGRSVDGLAEVDKDMERGVVVLSRRASSPAA